MNDADDDLVRLAMAGHRGAFETLIRRSTRLVWASLLLHTNDRSLAEDLTQETFLRAWRSIGTLQSPEAFRPWLLTVAERVRLDEYKFRSRKRRAKSPGNASLKIRSEAVPEAVATSTSPADAAAENDEKERVLAALRTLPDAYQQALSLRYLGGADYEQMERELSLTNGSLRGLLHRGLDMLRQRLSQPAEPSPKKPAAAIPLEAGQL